MLQFPTECSNVRFYGRSSGERSGITHIAYFHCTWENKYIYIKKTVYGKHLLNTTLPHLTGTSWRVHVLYCPHFEGTGLHVCKNVDS